MAYPIATGLSFLIQAHILRAIMFVIATSDTLDVLKMIEVARTLSPDIETVLRTHNERACHRPLWSPLRAEPTGRLHRLMEALIHVSGSRIKMAASSALSRPVRMPSPIMPMTHPNTFCSSLELLTVQKFKPDAALREA